MKILVCISNVPDTVSKINFKENDTQFETNGVQFIINPFDEFSLTRAIWFKEKEGAHITVVTVGLANSEAILRKALSMGVDEAVRIDLEPMDSLSVATQLFNYAKDKSFDIIFTGKESIDYNGGMVSGMLATLLDYCFVNACIGLEKETEKLNAKREIDGGFEDLVSNMPVVIAGQKGLVEEKDLKIPNMRGIMTARSKKIEIISPLVGSKNNFKVLKFEKPPQKSECKMIDPENIDELIQLLNKEAKVL